MDTVRIEDVVVIERIRSDVGDIESLAASIEEVGLLHPIVVDEECRLIAGARRMCAAELLGWDEIPVVILSGLDDVTKVIAEGHENTSRKAFTPEESVRAADRIRPLVQAAARQRQREHGGTAPGRAKNTSGNFPGVSPSDSRDDLGEAVGMSGKTLDKAKAVVDEADQTGDRELVDQMNRTGKVDRAYKALKKRKAKKERQEAAAKVKVEDNSVVHCDFRDLPVESGSAQLVFTDPPYDRKFLPTYADLGAFARRVLVPGGSLVTYLGSLHVPDVCRMLTDAGLQFVWPLCVVHTGRKLQMREYGIRNHWKPLLWFVNGRMRFDPTQMLDDLIESREEKGDHPWQQSVLEARYYIERLTDPDGLVVDPFCGSGTTSIAAKEIGRPYLTCDTDESAVLIASGRLS